VDLTVNVLTKIVDEGSMLIARLELVPDAASAEVTDTMVFGGILNNPTDAPPLAV
jgi:hypothetical protein